jgi:hypothetical protein
MFDPKANKQPKTAAAPAPKGSLDELAVKPAVFPQQNQIRDRAYELYESRGREPGQDERDWLRAEKEILKSKCA